MKREEMAMEKVFEAINGVFSFIGPLSDFLWEFPTNFEQKNFRACSYNMCATSILVHFPSGFLCYGLLYRIGLKKSYLFSLFLYKFQNFLFLQAPPTAIAFRTPARDLLDSSQADIRNPLRYAALHRITASQFIRLYKIFNK